MSIEKNLEIIAENVPKVYEAGKKAQYDEFWDTYQNNGNPIGYGQSAFMFAGSKWNDKTFYPKYDINLIGAACVDLFNTNGCTNLKQRLEELGLKIMSTSSSGITSLHEFFKSANSKELPPIYNVNGNALNMSRFAEKMTNLLEVPYYDFFNRVVNFTGTFNGCTKLEKIVGIDFSSATTTTSCFTNCSKLTDITAHGTIPVSINFSPCPLSVASLKSIITALKQFDAYTCTLTLKSSAFEALEAEGATAEYNGVACTWAELIDNKKWNLVKA